MIMGWPEMRKQIQSQKKLQRWFPFLPIIKCKNIFEHNFQAGWRECWRVEETWRHLYQLRKEPTKPSMYHSIARATEMFAAKAKILHIAKGNYIYCFNLKDSPNYEQSIAQEETLEHILLQFISTNHAREALLSLMGQNDNFHGVWDGKCFWTLAAATYNEQVISHKKPETCRKK